MPRMRLNFSRSNCMKDTDWLLLSTNKTRVDSEGERPGQEYFIIYALPIVPMQNKMKAV